MTEYHVELHEPQAIHHTALLGAGSVVWQFTTILEGVSLGKECVIGACVFLGRRCQIGDGTRIHPGAALPDGTVIGQRVFIGSNVSLMDTRYPHLRDKTTEVHRPPVIEDDVVIGCNACILPGVVVHRGAVVGAGAVVTRDVAPGAVVAGNPARHVLTAARERPALNEAGEVVAYG